MITRLAILLLATGLLAEEAAVDFHGLRLTPPKGWAAQTEGKSLRYSPPGGSSTTGIFVSAPEPSEGGPLGALERMMAGLEKGAQVLTKEGPSAGERVEGRDTATLLVVLQDPARGAYVACVIAVDTEAGVQTVSLASTSTEDFQRHVAAFQAFCEGVMPRTAAAATPPKAPVGGLEGLYLGTWTETALNINNQIETRLRRSYYLFLPGARVYQGCPTGGLDAFDFERARSEDATRCGGYAIRGGTLRVEWGGDREASEVAFEHAAEGTARIRGRRHFRMHTETSGMHIDGVFVNSRSTTTQAGAVTGETAFAFDASGRYAVRNWTGIWGDVESPSGSAFLEDGRVLFAGSSEFGEAGTYRIGPGTIEWAIRGGERKRATFFVEPQNAGASQPGILFIDGAGYLLQK